MTTKKFDDFVNETQEEINKIPPEPRAKKEFSSGGSRRRQYEVMKHVKENYPDRLKVELFVPGPGTQRVIMPDDSEVLVWYDFRENKVVNMSIPKMPILRCRACGFTFDHKNKECNCSEGERLFVDIDAMNYYYRVSYSDNGLEKLEVVRGIERRE